MYPNKVYSSPPSPLTNVSRAPVDLSLLTTRMSRSHSDAPYSVGLLRSACRRDHYLTIHNTHKGQTSIPLVGFEPTIPASKQLQTHVLDHAANQSPNCINPRTIIQNFNSQFSTYQLIFWSIRKENDEQKRKKEW
jgi:hypothetical protein